MRTGSHEREILHFHVACGAGAGAWDANPWVAAITFRVVRANIDAPEARIAA